MTYTAFSNRRAAVPKWAGKHCRRLNPPFATCAVVIATCDASLMIVLRDCWGGIAQERPHHGARSGQWIARGSWNKWRGPTSSWGGAVYAAKVRAQFVDGEHGVIR